MPIKPDGAADAAPSEADSQPTWIEVDSSLAPPALQPALPPPLPPLAWRWFLPLPFCLLGLALLTYRVLEHLEYDVEFHFQMDLLSPRLLCAWAVCLLRIKATVFENLYAACLAIPVWLAVFFSSSFYYSWQSLLFLKYGADAVVLLFLSVNLMLFLVYFLLFRAVRLNASALFLFFLSLFVQISVYQIIFFYDRGY